MSLPLPTLTFYRLPDVTVASANIQGLLDAIYSALIQTSDHRTTALPSTHLWTWTRYQNAGTTEAVYTTAVPSGPSVTPRIIFAGASAGSPTMASPDTFTASNVMVGVNKNSGAFNAWTAALPFTSGQFSGLTRVSGTAANATSTVVRAYVSEEVVFLDIIQSATSHWWVLAGAIIEPWTDDTSGGSVVSETDNRLFGMLTSGGGTALGNAFLSTATSNTFMNHDTGGGNAHGFVLVPNSTGIYSVEASSTWITAASTTTTKDLAGKHMAQAVDMVRDGGGAAMGRLREVYRYGSAQGGLTVRDGSTDKLHVVGCNTTSADDAIVLRAAA